jgi:hypothetical protein
MEGINEIIIENKIEFQTKPHPCPSPANIISIKHRYYGWRGD